MNLKPLTMVDVSSPFSCKTRRLISNIDHMITPPKQNFAREAHVAEEINSEESADDFYEFTADDYYRLSSTKQEDKILKTQEMRKEEQEERRSRFTKAVIRVRFPDHHTVEATFHPSDKIQSLVDFLMTVVDRPELPFYLFTTPPKKVIKDVSMDFYSAGFVPGAIVYLSSGKPN